MSFIHSFFWIFCLFIISIVHALPNDPYEQFKTMMGQKGMWEWENVPQKKLWKILPVQNNAKKTFNQYIKAIEYLKQDPINTIPKTIHFIWIGPKKFPEKSVANLISWKKHHPTWTIFFWTDDPNRSLPIKDIKRRCTTDFDFGPIRPYLEQTHNWGAMSDLMRYMIVYKEGGIYVDHDVECIRPLDPLTSHYDFVAGYSALHNYHFSLNSPFVPNNGVIASRPHHPIMKKTIERLCDRWTQTTQKETYESFSHVVSQTFDPFAYCVTQFIEIPEYRNIILPASYFHSAWSFDERIFKELIEQGYVYAIHRYAYSWQN